MTEIRHCRTCFSTENLSPIFSHDKPSRTRHKELFLVTGVEIRYKDDLSQLICANCNQTVNECIKLRHKSKETQKLLISNRNSLENNAKMNRRKKQTQNDTYAIENNKNDSLNNECKNILENNIKLKLNSNEITQKHIERTINNIKRTRTEIKSNNIKNTGKTTINKIRTSNLNMNRTIDDKTTLNKGSIRTIVYNKTIDDSCIVHEDSIDGDLMESNDVCKDSNENLKIFDDSGSNVRSKRKRLSQVDIQKYMSLAVQPVSRKGPVRCSLCRIELRERRFFVNHAKTHFEAEHACLTCGKKFTNINTLRYHQQRVHGAPRRLACPQCPFRAVDRGTLQNHHRAAHTGERPFTCDVCGDTFRVRSTIVQHMRTHFGNYDVQCERCPALFRSRSELASHRNKVHLMTYTYYCYLCPGSYKAVGTVKNHIVKVHGVPRDQHQRIKCVKTRRPSNDVKA